MLCVIYKAYDKDGNVLETITIETKASSMMSVFDMLIKRRGVVRVIMDVAVPQRKRSNVKDQSNVP